MVLSYFAPIHLFPAPGIAHCISMPVVSLINMLSDAALESALRDTVGKIYDSGDLEELTVKRVRATAEHELRLAEGFFKQGEWKNQSKSIIEEEAVSFKTEYVPSAHSSHSLSAATSVPSPPQSLPLK